MKNYLFAAAIIILAGCSSPEAGNGKDEQCELNKQNIELVKKFLKASENEDIEAWKEVMADGAVWYGPRYEQYDTVDADFWEGIKGWFKSIDSVEFDVVEILAHNIEEGDLAGDWVLLWCFESWYSLEAEKKVTVFWHAPMRIEEGKINWVTSMWNQWDLYKQLGAKLNWPVEEKE